MESSGMGRSIHGSRSRSGQANETEHGGPHLRVAAYCRVSTDQEEQETSYDAQVEYYYRYILSHKNWDYSGIYADEGISGTGTKKREGFNRMIRDCRQGEIDLILTKSISRFARNTLDCLHYIRMLKELGIAVYFEKENVNTLDAKGEVLISIMASLAQQESQSISENIRMGISYQFQRGKVRVNHTHFLGYTKDKEGNLIIVEKEAEIVRRIYREFLEGKSYNEIARGLTADQIPTPAGKSKWYLTTVQSILKNEKYMGDVLLQKYYTKDFLTKKKVINDGVRPQYYIENDHEPIVSKEIFERVQAEIGIRKMKKEENQTEFPNYYALSGIIICSYCRSHYYRINMNGQNRHSTWRCKNRVKSKKGCKGPIFKEEDLQAAVLMALDQNLEKYKSYCKWAKDMRTDILPALEEERELITGMLDTMRQEMAAMESVKVNLIEQLESAKKRKRELDKKIESYTEEAEELQKFVTYLDYYRKIKAEKNGNESCYEEKMMHMILKEVKVCPGYLLISFCTGDPQIIPIREK